jgi:isoaspartyl peptidase/L-asparaginase-like protein (Ntn-hydrolase superfamily)
MLGIVIHGGAGTLPRAEMSGEAERRYRAALGEAIDAGYAVLQGGGTSLDAVTRAVVLLEDNPLFNAGRGSVFTHDGRNELDASIMEGQTLKAGAVCGLTRIRNPVELARAVMESSEHVMLAGAGAEEFATSLRTAKLLPHSRTLATIGANSLRRIWTFRAHHFARRYRRSGCAGHSRPRGRGDIHRRHDRQALSAHR